MKKIIIITTILFCSLSGSYAMHKSPLTVSEKRSSIVYKFTLRDALTASTILSAPVASILSGICAYDYGFSLSASMACSLGTAVSYGVIIKALMYQPKK